ncbi:MAG: putative transporter [Lentisphaerae bacterium]|nr:putative transporter [Lentisphaerota bacterium]
MQWLTDLVHGSSIAQAMMVLCLVASIGLFLGHLKVRGIGLGIAGVLFSGLAFAHFGVAINNEVMEFAREFGLILFVYTIGMQVGPGFFGSLRRQGAPLNALAAAIVFIGAGITLLIHHYAHVPMAAAVGILTGATTNTPSLGAAQQALKSLPTFTEDLARLPGLGYAVTYPFGIIGIILAMLIIRFVFRIRVHQEEESFQRLHARHHAPLAAQNLRVTNPNLRGLRLDSIPGLRDSGVVISRVEHDGTVRVGLDDTLLQPGDTVLAVGPPAGIEQLRIVMGELSPLDLRALSGRVQVRRFVVTNKHAVGKSIEDLDLEEIYGVRFTRVSRADVDLPNPGGIRLQAGDSVTAVGEEDALAKVEKTLGNSLKDLNEPNVIPVFVGIALGIVVGSIPLVFPGIPAPLKLGLAGGPLVVAILLSYIGRVGPLVWHMQPHTNFLLRELGIVLFLACVGLKAGGQFVHTLLAGDGLWWMAAGAVITLVPLLVVGLIGRIVLRTNYLTLCGVLAGSMTDPPALAFANSVTTSEAPAVSYATVYPLTMLLRVVCAQILVLTCS